MSGGITVGSTQVVDAAGLVEFSSIKNNPLPRGVITSTRTETYNCGSYQGRNFYVELRSHDYKLRLVDVQQYASLCNCNCQCL